MNATIAIWATSVVGAIVFLAAGFFWGRVRTGVTPAAPTPSASEGALLRREATRLETRLTEAEAERDRAVTELNAAVGARNEALRGREEALAKLQASPVTSSGEPLQYQVISLETEVRQLREEKVILNTKAVALEHELDQLRRQENKKGDDEVVKKLVTEQARMERRRKELELTRTSLDRHKVENHKLKANIRTLEAEKVRLEMQLEDVQHEVEEDGHDTQRFSAVSITPIADMPGDDLQAQVDSLARGANVRVAVLADSLGLKVVGRGDETDELAAAAALLADVAQRAARLLPVEEIERLELVSDGAVRTSIYPFNTARGELVLASMAEGDSPDHDLVDRVKERVARLV